LKKLVEASNVEGKNDLAENYFDPKERKETKCSIKTEKNNLSYTDSPSICNTPQNSALRTEQSANDISSSHETPETSLSILFTNCTIQLTESVFFTCALDGGAALSYCRKA
jgi:hypothetical protein